jgi:hypothetical protein
MLRILHTTWVIAVVVGVAGSALAQPPRNPPPGRPATTNTYTGTTSMATAGSGKFLAIPGLFPLSMTSVQREIGLTPDQKQQLKALSDGYMASVQQLGKAFNQLGPEEKQKQGKEFSERATQAFRNTQRKAESILSPQQLQTVQRIAAELSGTGALADPKVQEKIGLSAEQRQRLTAVFDQAGEKMQQLQRATAQQAMQVLEDEQKAALKQQVESQQKPQ